MLKFHATTIQEGNCKSLRFKCVCMYANTCTLNEGDIYVVPSMVLEFGPMSKVSNEYISLGNFNFFSINKQLNQVAINTMTI